MWWAQDRCVIYDIFTAHAQDQAFQVIWRNKNFESGGETTNDGWSSE